MNISVPALPFDEKSHVTSTFQSLKLKKDLVAIFLRIVEDKIRVVGKLASEDGKFEDVVKFLEDLGERDCCYVVYDHRYQSDDGILKLQKLFLITYIPRTALTEDKLKYDMQKGKNLLALTKGIEISVSDPNDLKRKVYGISNVRRKTVYKDEVEEENEDWMDE
jgi:hypothetical protein